MTYCKINEWTIPIVGEGEEVSEEIGDRALSFSGQELVDRRAFKRKWALTTPSLAQTVADAVRALVQGRHDALLFTDQSVFTDKGLGPVSNGGENFRVAIGAVGGHAIYDHNGKLDARFAWCLDSAIASENDLPLAVRSTSSLTGFTVIAGATLSIDVLKAMRGASSLKTVSIASGDGYATPAWGSVYAGDWAGSVYLWCDAAKNINLILRGNVSGDTTATFNHPGDSTWRRAVVQKTVTTDTTLQLRVVAATGGAFSFWSACPQLAPQATSAPIFAWYDDAGATQAIKSSDTLVVVPGELLRFDDWTFACWVNGENATTLWDRVWFEAYVDAQRSIKIETLAGSKDLRTTIVKPGSSTDYTDSNVLDLSWHHIAVINRRNAATGGYGLEVWRDGVFKMALTPISVGGIDTRALTSINLAYRCGRMAELQFLPFAASAEMLAALGSASRTYEIAAPPRVRLSGDIVCGDPVAALGKTASETQAGRQVSGAWQNNRRQVEFELREV
jgi:hypothetical protein